MDPSLDSRQQSQSGRPEAAESTESFHKLHNAGEWPIDGTMKLTVYLLEQAMQKLEETGSDTVLGIFDLRQFTSANADFSYAVRLVRSLPMYFHHALRLLSLSCNLGLQQGVCVH